MPKSFDISQWARAEMLALKPYTSARDTFTAKEGEWTFLDANENPNATEVNRYPDPNQTDLKQVIATLRGCDPEQILIGNGSDEVLDLIFRAFCSPFKDEVLLMPPTYGMYAVLANINSIGMIEVPLSETFQLKPKEILAAVTPNTKAMFFCSPNNPSGNAFNNEDIQLLLDNFNGIIVIDEAYIDFTDLPSWSEKQSEYPNLIITQTLSKAFGMAGLRLGIAIASPEIIALLTRIKPPYNINTLSQKEAIASLNDVEMYTIQIEEIKSERMRLEQLFATLPWVDWVYPSDANFLLVKVDDASKRYAALLENKIVSRDRSSQLNCKNCIRISVGTVEENDKLIAVCKSLTI
jgi:histidinol-phosphate aminotransferase